MWCGEHKSSEGLVDNRRRHKDIMMMNRELNIDLGAFELKKTLLRF